MQVAILNGPNLGRLGVRQPDIYGNHGLEFLQASLSEQFPMVQLEFFQSNSEGGLIDRLEAWHDQGIRLLVINAGAYTHSSYALRDALDGMDFRAVEVHISNIYARESFRHRSVLASVVEGQISGLGLKGYALAIRFLVES